MAGAVSWGFFYSCFLVLVCFVVLFVLGSLLREEVKRGRFISRPREWGKRRGEERKRKGKMGKSHTVYPFECHQVIHLTEESSHLAKDEMETITEDKWDEDIWGIENEGSDDEGKREVGQTQSDRTKATKSAIPKLIFYFGEKVSYYYVIFFLSGHS